MDNRFSVVPTSRLAIKFQALTGLRYIDVTGAAEGAATANRMTTVPTTMTQPSFDITVLFNGLQPVLGNSQSRRDQYVHRQRRRIPSPATAMAWVPWSIASANWLH